LPIRVKLLYFGQARDASGREEEEFTLPDRSSAAVLLGESSAAHPKIEKIKRSIQIAVNEEIADPGRMLQEGDIVAFLPPVAGG
jgi:molybdopterin converting factor subunit 1